MPRPAPADARSRIAEIIGESVYHALGLKESLVEERLALQEQDTDALSAVVDNKTTCSDNLQVLDGRRSDLCLEWGFSDGPDQMDALIDWCDENDLIRNRWDQLMILAAEGSALNLTNGAIIRVRQQQFESTLSVLRGVMPGSDTYGRNGGETGDFSRRSLAEA